MSITLDSFVTIIAGLITASALVGFLLGSLAIFFKD